MAPPTNSELQLQQQDDVDVVVIKQEQLSDVEFLDPGSINNEQQQPIENILLSHELFQTGQQVPLTRDQQEVISRMKKGEEMSDELNSPNLQPNYYHPIDGGSVSQDLLQASQLCLLPPPPSTVLPQAVIVKKEENQELMPNMGATTHEIQPKCKGPSQKQNWISNVGCDCSECRGKCLSVCLSLGQM